nr:unnamed protein product [Leishmania braziliensis]
MHQRVDCVPPALAVTGKGLLEGTLQSKFVDVAPTTTAASAHGGSAAAAAERRSPTRKQPLVAKKVTSRDPRSRQQGKWLGQESQGITTMATTVSSCPVAGRQNSLLSLPQSRETAVEVSLVQNLKKQIACLELQLRVMKQQQDAMARMHRDSSARHDAERAKTSRTTSAARLMSVELPLLHAERIRHADAAAVTVKTPQSDDDAIARMRGVPAAYQTERSILLHNLESLTKDVEGLQALALHLGRERDLMATEVIDFRAALREMKIENEAMAAECAAMHQLLETEQALRRAAEESVSPSTKGASSHRNIMTAADALSQRAYYKLQAERTAEALTLTKAKVHTLSDALQRERDAAKILEAQLCGGLDRIALMERRESALALYYQQLSGRFVTISSMLRHVLDVVPNELLQHQRIPSPERVPASQSAAAEMTMAELRETLDAWHSETTAVMANAQHTTETITGGALALFEATTVTTVSITSDGDDEPPFISEEAAVTVPPPRIEVAQQSEPLPPPLHNPFVDVGAAAQMAVVLQDAQRGDRQDTHNQGATVSVPMRSEELSVPTEPDSEMMPSRAAPQRALLAEKTSVVNPTAVYHAAEIYKSAELPVNEKSGAVHVVFAPAELFEKKQTAEMTAESSLAAPVEKGITADIPVDAPSSSGDTYEVPPAAETPSGITPLSPVTPSLYAALAAHVISDNDPIPVLSSKVASLDGEDTPAFHPPHSLTFTATVVPEEESPAPTSEGGVASENGVLPQEPQSTEADKTPPAGNLEPPTTGEQVRRDAGTETAAAGEAVPAVEIAVPCVPLPLLSTVTPLQAPSPPRSTLPPSPLGVAISPPLHQAFLPVLLPPALPLPPTAAIPTSVLPTPPVPPPLEQQLELLNVRIDTQEAALAEMVRRYGGSS